MSELIQIWDGKDLAGAATLPPFNIPNNPNARSLKINNQSRFWIYITRTNTGQKLDRIEPFSYLILPYEPDLSLALDTSDQTENSSLMPDRQFVDYTTINLSLGIAKGSTQFSGSSTVTIGGSVNIGNSQLAVDIQGTPTFNLANNTVTIGGTPTFNVGTMPAVTFAAGSSVQITGTPTMNINSMPAVTFAAGSQVSITGTPTMNINSMPAVTIGNATLNVKLDQTGGNNTVNIAGTPSVSISGTPTINVGTMPAVTFAAGSQVSITGTPTMNINSMPAVTISNATLKVAIDTTSGNNNVVIQGTPTVQISGTPTINVGTMPSVTIGNATLNVKFDQTGGNNAVTISGTPSVTIANSSVNVSVQGTPTFNLGAGATVSISGTPTFNVGTMPAVTFAAGSTVSISGTPTMNINSMPAVTFAAGSTVSISGTPTMNINSMPNVTIASGTVNVSSATISNNQLPVTMLYNGSKSLSFPSGSTQSYNVQFLPAGNMIEFHRVTLYIKSLKGYSYNLSGLDAYTQFADGTNLRSASNGGSNSLGINAVQDPNDSHWWIIETNYPQTANNFNITISTTSGGNVAAADTLTLYYCIDGNDTALEIPQNDGVAVKPSQGNIIDNSGTITTANTSQAIISNGTKMRYLYFQNLSGADMYANIVGNAAGTGPGNILIPAGGGDLVFESGFIPNNGLNIYCSTAGAAFTCLLSQ